MAEVAMAVHSGLGQTFENRNFVCASSPEADIYNLFNAGTAGRGLNNLGAPLERLFTSMAFGRVSSGELTTGRRNIGRKLSLAPMARSNLGRLATN